MSEEMVYVAVNPSQPNAAYAICIGDISDKLIRETVMEWLQEGANILRVPISEGLKMMDLWMDRRNTNES